MLIDEANKLYIFLAERLLCDIVNENVSKQPILPTVALPAAAALPSEEGGLNDDKQEVLDEEEYQTDEQSEQYKLTDDNASSEYFEDDKNKADRFTDDYQEDFTD